MNCCNQMPNGCRQGRDCPNRYVDNSGYWAWWGVATILAVFSLVVIASCAG